MNFTVDAHVYAETEIDLHRSDFDRSPVLSLGESAHRVTLYFNDDAAARRFAAAILDLVGQTEAATRALCPYCGTHDHLEGSPASDRCRERAVNQADPASSCPP